MCGIAATIGLSDATAFTSLFGAIGHRGPDESGIRESGDIRIGMHRLAIVGRMGDSVPLIGADGLVLAFNGEIYNHQALRADFPDYPFAGQSDAEVLFPLLKRHGLGGLDRLRGMFAFVLTDMESGEFLAVRDPFGIKPLYYAETGGGFAFASEMKAFAAMGITPRFLPPGHLLTRHGLRRWYRVPGRFRLSRRPNLRALLERAVASHLPPEGPCGVFLSGGLDSSLVAALAARSRPDMVAYSVVLPGSPDEEPAALMAAHLGIRHKVLRATADDIRAALPEVIGALESFNPIMVRNAVPLYLLSKMAAKDCKVVLGGDGADELFAGYDYLSRVPRRFWPQAMDYGFSNLHRTELQRVDRMTMAHGLELRVPFLDREVAEAAVNLPLSAKFGIKDGTPMPKLALREAAEGLLPPSIQWRRKLPLADGSGFGGLDLGAGRDKADPVPGWDVGDEDAVAFFPLWRVRFPLARPDSAIWRDCGRYHDFEECHGRPLLELFRR
ncbi:Asparagine synthetase glutamine-hydrolyzing [Paramagnetospirillum magnetotacticum MS-1]|uniref:asparagine synthase (glutamine-hydrolyzing) n=1 Tax=Paramagnetospirillum magnetotacticum MS-1 TaxID=272627 RepID=A0A0C2YZV3_PARME|nr:asparagine synthase-related protein [Paramagnetospirillum magnetotacticum]KIM00171.1 Asparagine synthetase glutamine-hydrolyzing [Paramagnetospirillum magnetotacticum MS-1]